MTLNPYSRPNLVKKANAVALRVKVRRNKSDVPQPTLFQGELESLVILRIFDLIDGLSVWILQ